jgi:periplasmic protein CpxP/Spy
MKRIFTRFIALLLLFTTTFVHAQEGWTNLTPQQRAAKLTKWMQNNLHLSQDQATQAQQINLKYAQMQEDLKDAGGSRSEKMKQAKANEQAKDEELKQVMTQDQFTSYQIKKQTMQEQLREQRKARNGEL